MSRSAHARFPAAAAHSAAAREGAAPTADVGSGAAARGARRTALLVWLGVAGGFLLLALAWTALFVAAGRVQTQFIAVPRAESSR